MPISINGTTGLTGVAAIETATVTINGTSGNTDLNLNTTAGSAGRFLFNTGSSSRWGIYKGSTAESGANAGSNFEIKSFDDAGAFLATPLTITRSTGKVNLESVGATAGLELGASGPRIMSGSGSPEGVVTAPVGSRWIRTDGDTLGDFEYTKRSGTGNTGWQVTVGDTGWRAMTLDNSWTGTLRVRRVGPQVEWRGKITAPGGGGTGYPLIALPTGYSPGGDASWYLGTPVRSGTTGDMGWVEVDVGIHMRDGVATNVYPVWITYLTTAAWPTALPGSAA